MEIFTKSAKETKKIGELLAREIINVKSPASPSGRSVSNISWKLALIISLEGELGAGKTTFVQGFAKGLGIKENPRSPTFVIMRVYSIPVSANPYPNPSPFVRGKGKKKNNPPPYEGGGWGRLIHIDAYRITSKDLKNLGWKEIVSNPKNIILIEWGGRVRKILPRNALRVKFKHGKLPHERFLRISNF